jgi:hypothetical protein
VDKEQSIMILIKTKDGKRYIVESVQYMQNTIVFMHNNTEVVISQGNIDLIDGDFKKSNVKAFMGHKQK